MNRRSTAVSPGFKMKRLEVLMIGVLLLSNAIVPFNASADDLLDAPASTSYQLYPSEVQDERLELQRSERWRGMSTRERVAALRAIDRKYLKPDAPQKETRASLRSAEPRPLAPRASKAKSHARAKTRKALAKDPPDTLRDAPASRPGPSSFDEPMIVTREARPNPAAPQPTFEELTVISDLERPTRSGWDADHPARRERRGGTSVEPSLRGVVRPGESFVLRAPVDGKLENEPIPLGRWLSRKDAVATVVPSELAAILDSPQTTPKEELLRRWSSMFRPTPVTCTSDCFVLAARARPGATVHQGDVIAEATRYLALEADIRSEIYVDGNAWRSWSVEFWLKSDPERRWEAPVSGIFDGKLICRLPPGTGVEVGAAWEGRLRGAQTSWSALAGGN